MNPDSKLLAKLSRRVREAKASSPSVEAVWLFSEEPRFSSHPLSGVLLIDGVRVQHYFPSAVLPPEARP